MATAQIEPPAGFVLDQPTAPPPPPGFELDTGEERVTPTELAQWEAEAGVPPPAQPLATGASRGPAFFPGREGEGGLYDLRVSKEFQPPATAGPSLNPLEPILAGVLPRYEPLPQVLVGPPSKLESIAGGMYNALTGATESMTSPAVLLSGGAAGAIPALARPVAATWAAIMAKDIPKQVEQVNKVFKEDRPLEEKVEAATGLALSLGFTATAAKGALTPTPTPGRVAGEMLREQVERTEFPKPGDIVPGIEAPIVESLRAAKAPLTAAVVEQTLPARGPAVEGKVPTIAAEVTAPPPVARPAAEPKVTAIEMDDFRHLIKKAADAPTPKTPEELADTVVKALTEVLPKQGETPGKRLLMEFGISKADVMPLSESEVLSELKGIAANPADWKVVPGTYKANQLEYLLKQAKAPTPPAEAAPVVGKAPAISEKQITDLAESKGIPWDYDPAFMDFTEGLTGKRHLSELNAEQRGSVFEAIQARPAVQERAEEAKTVQPSRPVVRSISREQETKLRQLGLIPEDITALRSGDPIEVVVQERIGTFYQETGPQAHWAAMEMAKAQAASKIKQILETRQLPSEVRTMSVSEVERRSTPEFEEYQRLLYAANTPQEFAAVRKFLDSTKYLSFDQVDQFREVLSKTEASIKPPAPAVEAKGEVTPAAPAEQAIAFPGIGSLREKQATAPGELLPAKEMPFNLAGEREATPVPLESKPTVPVEQGELFQVQRITSIKDPAKSADAAQELYGNAFAAARTLRRQLDVIDSDPQTRKSFKKTQRAALNEVLRMLDERAAKTEAAAPRPELRIDALDMGERDFTMPVLRTLPMRDKAKWEKVKKYFGATSVPKIAELAKRRFEQRRIPSPEAERQAFLSGSHIAGIPDPISLAFAVTFGTKTGRETLGNVVRFYSEPLTERLASEGGQNSKGFANMGKEIAQRAKELFGSITPTLDPALEATGKMNRTTTWLNDIAETPRKWGYRNAVRAVEGPIEKVPAEHRPTVELLKASNLDIGKLAEPAVEGFKATGRYQRPPTAVLIDAIRAAKGPVYETVMQALAAENAMPLSKVKKIFKDIKAEFDEPGSKQTVHRIAQEFERHFKKFPTDIKVATPFGEVWVPILHAKPFDYLQNAAQRTAQRVAFLERVPQGTLAELRKQVVSELKDPSAFDDLIRALHGLPVNEPLRLFAPGTIQEMIASGANRVLSDVFAPLKLTVSAIYNIPETILGNASAFGGYRNFIKGAVTLKARHEQLEILGAINRAIYNFSWDPKAPIRSILADFRQGLRKVTLQQFFNEMQEMLAASTAQVFAERAQGRVLSAREQGLFTETATAMGFNRLAANAMARGNGTIEQYGNFVRRSAAFSAGGNIQPAEMSRFGGNRVLGGLFKFQSYPIMQLNAFRKAYTNFADAIESKDPRRIKASSEILAKFLFNTTARGAAAAFLAALLSGRGGGVQQTAEEAEDNPGKFVFDSVAGGMGGPVSAINYVVGTGKTRDLVNPKNINAGITFPGSIYLELKQLFNTEGPYAGMTLPQATEKYLRTRVPAGKMIRHAFEEAGLASKAESTFNNVYRLHQDWMKRNPNPAIREDYERKLGQTFGESQYSGILAAIKARDADALKKEVGALRAKGVKLSLIKERLDTRKLSGEREQLFHSKKEWERAFLKSLTADQRKLYDAALREREAQWTWFRRYF